jgi:hypothetical protein
VIPLLHHGWPIAVEVDQCAAEIEDDRINWGWGEIFSQT